MARLRHLYLEHPYQPVGHVGGDGDLNAREAGDAFALHGRGQSRVELFAYQLKGRKLNWVDNFVVRRNRVYLRVARYCGAA